MDLEMAHGFGGFKLMNAGFNLNLLSKKDHKKNLL
jgi:hypothetical protein